MFVLENREGKERCPETDNEEVQRTDAGEKMTGREIAEDFERESLIVISPYMLLLNT